MTSKEQLDRTIDPVVEANVEMQKGQLAELEIDEAKQKDNVEYDYHTTRNALHLQKVCIHMYLPAMILHTLPSNRAPQFAWWSLRPTIQNAR